MTDWQGLIDESRQMDGLASKFEGKDQHGALRALEDRYGEWYASCLAALPDDLKDSFRSHYDDGSTGIHGTTIKAFLNVRIYPPGPQAVAATPGFRPQGLSYSWPYAYRQGFHPRIVDQRIILIEASKRAAAPRGEGGEVTNDDMRRIVEGLIQNAPQPSVDSNQAYEWLIQVEAVVGHLGPQGKTFESRLAKVRDDYENMPFAATISPRGDILSSSVATTEPLINGGLGVLRGMLKAIDNGIVGVPASRAAEPFPSSPSGMRSPGDATVFVVHGHDNEAKQTVARLLEWLGINVTILHEQTDEGRTLIEKLEQHANPATFAVILLTPDDVGASQANKRKLAPRPRQNVVLELGYFYGRLGRKNVCPLYKEGVELPSDMSGIVYTLIDDGGQWKYKLARELQAAGIGVDLNRIR